MCTHRNGKVRAVLASAVAVGAMLLIAGPAPAETLYVDDDAPPGGDGLAWPTAFRCLQDALYMAASAPGWITEIRIGQGTYQPDEDEGGHVTPGDRTATFHLVSDLSLLGGYAGYGAPDPDERIIWLYETILTGDLAGDDEPGFVNYEENSYHVVSAIACNDAAIIDGFTITAGNADGGTNFHRDRGGGFYNNDGYPLTVNCALTLNSAQTWGGAYYNTSGSFPMIESCSFTTNVSDEGGAIYSGSYSEPVIDHCAFDGNTALSSGGALYCDEHSSPTIADSTFDDNEADFRGGAVCNYIESAPVVTSSAFTRNAAGFGGGVFNYVGSRPTITECAFTDNRADGWGGGMANHENYLTLIACVFHNNMANDGGALSVWDHADATNTVFDCTFTWNWADSYGGAILDLEDDLMLMDCLFFANSAGVGGGIFANDSDTTLTDCTFTSNHVFSSGGGMRSAGGSATLVRCNFNQNIADSGGGMYAGDYSTLVDCTFDANVALSNGGGMVDWSPSVHQDCVFTRNFAADNGGGVASYNGEHDWVKCVFAENTASDGGGIHSREADARAVNCIFVGNRAFTYGGALCSVYTELSAVNCTFSSNLAAYGRSLGCDSIDQNYPSSVWMANCICWNGGDEVWNNDNSSIVIGHTCIADGYDGEGNIFLDPLFVDPVGPDGYPGTEDDDLRLAAGSPCIDAADNTAVPPDTFDLDGDGDTEEPIPIDLDGNPRFVDDPDTEDTGFGDPPIVDMGAYEYQPESPECPADFDGDGDVDTADLLFLLAAWGTPDGDVDGDGDTDTADLLALLAAWGECPE